VAASPLLAAGEETIKYDNDGDGLFAPNCSLDSRRVVSKNDQSIPIVAGSEENSELANSPLKSKAKKFDGSSVGFRPSAERGSV
jgi:hypothetical protein